MSVRPIVAGVALLAGLAAQLDEDSAIEDVGIVVVVVALLVLVLTVPRLLVDRDGRRGRA